jgi:hypothetical protein
MANIITPDEVRDWFADADDDEVTGFLEEGLTDVIGGESRPQKVKDMIIAMSDHTIQTLLDDNGLQPLIENLEEDDFFGTEGFAKRFA